MTGKERIRAFGTTHFESLLAAVSGGRQFVSGDLSIICCLTPIRSPSRVTSRGREAINRETELRRS